MGDVDLKVGSDNDGRKACGDVGYQRHGASPVLSVWGQQDNICYFFVICVLSGTFPKGMAEGSLLSKDECLTPNIDKVMPM